MASADLEVAVLAEVAPVAAGKIVCMKTYTIDVGKIEELQTLSDTRELEKIFSLAKSTIVNGESVVLVRKDKSGNGVKFEEFTTLPDLELYKKRVFRYL